MTKRTIYKTIRELDANLSPKEEGFKVACLLLKGMETQNVHILSKFFNYPLPWVEKIAKRLKQNGVWKQGRTYANWHDEENGGIGFWADVNVGLGFLKRTK